MPAASDSAMVRAEFSTTDTDVAHDYLRSEYADHAARLSGDRERFEFRAHTVQEERFGIEFVSHSMELDTVVEPYRALLVPHVLAGHIRLASRRNEVCAGEGDEFLIAPDARLNLRWRGPKLGIVRLDTEAVAGIAAETIGDGARFPLAPPVSAGRARYWRSVVRHVSRDFMSDPVAMASPLLRTELFRLLATALIETFRVTVDDTAPHGLVEPAAVRRAVAFIDDNAHREIGLTEIAEAARVGPRALQAAFRRHRGTTPTAYLREVRLNRAHLDLQAADPTAGDSVAAIATAWGFHHHGRFAVAYRERYGCTPRRTLHS
ncbi:AraC family transcriptional regulator [Actinomadura barringtoniae]|uniref:AraC family transcriptional regulator n=1 Tax=Actinomadura barringtoniae TaxID=1427535 RepID=A0A939P9H7_9ACTN|nr:AraC family transcriptional regulator [Actinomadura barringtoniae]MBO2448617.1 AraC family transcriptional regulator [Actinomadura barringtoniae]